MHGQTGLKRHMSVVLGRFGSRRCALNSFATSLVGGTCSAGEAARGMLRSDQKHCQTQRPPRRLKAGRQIRAGCSWPHATRAADRWPQPARCFLCRLPRPIPSSAVPTQYARNLLDPRKLAVTLYMRTGVSQPVRRALRGRRLLRRLPPCPALAAASCTRRLRLRSITERSGGCGAAQSQHQQQR